MDLIERYISTVTHRLPVDMRDDVSDELHGMIDEALEEKGSRSKKAVEEVLTKLGNPVLMAARYSSNPQYIIGPTMYPFFIESLKMVYGIGLPIVAAIGVIVQIAEPSETLIQSFLGVIGFTIGVGIQMLFWTLLVFFVIERSGVKVSELNNNSGWTPDMLPTDATKRQIPISSGAGDIIWYAIVAILPFIANSVIGAHANNTFTPLFNPDIWAVGTPILVTLGLVGIAKGIVKIMVGKWTNSLAVFTTVYSLVSSAVLIAAAMSVSLVNPAFISMVDAQITTSSLEQVKEAFTWIVGLNVAIFVGVYVYEAVSALYKAFRLNESK